MAHSLEPDNHQFEIIEKELLFTEMMVQFTNLQERFLAEGEDDEKRWMIENTNDSMVIEFLKQSTVLMLHVIDAIGELEPVNGISISKQYGLPRGSVSKVTRKLVELQMVRTESIPDNKKEVLFYLTESGWIVFELHKKLHKHIKNNLRNFLNRYDNEQLRFLVQCMKETSETSWVRGEFIEEKMGLEQNGSSEQLLPGSSSEITSTINDILSMMKQLEEDDLKKARDLIQLVFFK